jgi:excisionase family DNA binding protein
MSENFAMTTMQAANELHVSIGTLLRWVHEGKVPACKIGDRKYLFSRKALENLLSNQSLISGSNTQPPAAGAVN